MAKADLRGQPPWRSIVCSLGSFYCITIPSMGISRVIQAVKIHEDSLKSWQTQNQSFQNSQKFGNSHNCLIIHRWNPWIHHFWMVPVRLGALPFCCSQVAPAEPWRPSLELPAGAGEQFWTSEERHHGFSMDSWGTLEGLETMDHWPKNA